ncbi:Venom carboxylesterase-6 [Papilio machaon]|uniref:Venom carboxylesterase-6 n=1 Tax=Papilio machaon TaxID=76193 RepID=A0A194QX52_PAPMA|nr:Venom carboxylesterase-6 [Papilio machaon]
MLLLTLICAFALANAQAQDDPIVNTTQGRVQGSSAEDGNYYVFYGINYAGSVSGENRFKAPPPPPSYPGVFHANNSDVICSHPTSKGIVGVEDCLTLSIYTANLTASQPVLVWLQGEEYTTTDTTLRSFKNFVDRNVVVVNVNYRLSIFGFLCLGVPEAPGNAGLKDVVQALKWIQENIAGFGGNPNNVVLFGHGSGAAMVDLLTLSPSAENLMHKAITQSGSALSPGAIAYKPIEYAEALGAKLGYTGKSREELARMLTTTDITLLATALTEFEFFNNTALFAPCIENNVDSNNTIINDAPINIIRSGNYSHIPYMAGYTNKEGTIRAHEAAYSQWLEKMQTNFDDFIQVDLDVATNSNKTAIVESIREFYFSQRIINMKTIEDYLDYHGDTMILVSAIRGVRERALTSRAVVYLYEFAYTGALNSDWPLPQIPLTGVRHGGLLKYLLNINLTQIEGFMRETVMKHYLSFIYNGTQAIPYDSLWDPISSSRFPYLIIEGGEYAPNLSMSRIQQRYNPHERTMSFWNDNYATLYVAPSPVSSAAQLMSFFLLVGLFQLLLNVL